MKTEEKTASLFEELETFRHLENHDGYTFQLTERAYRTAKQYLSEFINYVSDKLPDLTPDGDGGIDLEWKQGDRVVMAVVRDSDKLPSYIYFEDSVNYGSRALSPELLREKLNWLQGR